MAVSPAVVLCTPLGALTANLSLCKPASGETNWDAALNNNFTVLDSLLPGALTAGNGKLLIGNGTGFSLANIAGTANQLTVTNSAGLITLSTPQNTDVAATAQFGSLGLGVAGGAAGTLKMTAKLLTYNNAAPTDGQLLIGGTSAGNFTAATLTGTTNQITVTNGNNTVTLATPQNIHSAATPQFAGLGVGGAANGQTGNVALTAFVFANIGTFFTANGQVGYCSDCTIANPCAGSGNGAIAKRLNGANVCN